MPTPIILDGNSLTIEHVVAVARQFTPVSISLEALGRLAESRKVVEAAADSSPGGSPPISLWHLSSIGVTISNYFAPPERGEAGLLALKVYKQSKTAGALVYYERVLAVDITFQDVGERINAPPKARG